MEFEGSGEALQECRHAGMEVGCRCCDVEVRCSEALEARPRREGVEIWRYGALEMRCIRADIEAWRYREPEARCRRIDIEV